MGEKTESHTLQSDLLRFKLPQIQKISLWLFISLIINNNATFYSL